jgi:alkylhydroperoxidase/carboxymuconolactone decarboxylase family protein YurZ
VTTEEVLRHLVHGETAAVTGALDARTAALVRVAALIALGAPPASYRRDVDAALREVATVDELVDTLRAVAPTVGLARVVEAASHLATAIGYDVDAALESHDPTRPAPDVE